jgi:hypothetical protein
MVARSTLPTGRASWFRRISDAGVGIGYFIGAHLYDGLCYSVSSLYSYPKALAIMLVILFLVSLILVTFHRIAESRLGWDVLELGDLRRLKNRQDISAHRIFRRLVAWTLRRGRGGIFLVGSILLGPPVVAVLLNDERSRRRAILLVVGGTLVSVVFWVTVWSGVGLFTWKQYVLPLGKMVLPS